MTLPFFGVDAFTERRFAGNPAAVCLLEHAPDRTGWMQRVAAEFNQSVTAFVGPASDGIRPLRWYTSTTELPLCGHGTLATAHVLYEQGLAGASDRIRFATATSELTAAQADGLVWLDLPAVGLTEAPVDGAVLRALGLTAAQWMGVSDYEYVVVVESPEDVSGARPDFPAILGLPVPRLIVTAAGGEGVDFTSRVFVPAIGLDEDPVTGSAHAVLAPLWTERLGRSRLRAAQASRRGGELAVEVRDDRVQVGGRAVTVTRGELVDPPSDGTASPRTR